MTSNEHAAYRDLIPAYGLGSLDPDEAGDLALHLKACPDCLALLAEYQSIVDSLALAAPDAAPSPALRGRLLAEINGSTKEVAALRPARVAVARPGKGAARRIDNRRAWPALAVVALAAVMIVGLLWAYTAGMMGDGRTVALLPTEFAPEANGELRFTRDGRAATLEVWRLPPLPAGQVYQLWLVADERQNSGALFRVNENGWAEVPVAMDRLAAGYFDCDITIEPEGGSPGPTGERVLVGEY